MATLMLLSSFLTSVAVQVFAQEVLTNDSMVRMVRAGFPERLIIAKIRSSQTNFDVGTDALIALGEAGIPDKVLAAIIAPSAQAAGKAAPIAAPADDAAPPPPPPVIPPQPAASVPIQLPPGVVVPPHVLEALREGVSRQQAPGAGRGQSIMFWATERSS